MALAGNTDCRYKKGVIGKLNKVVLPVEDEGPFKRLKDSMSDLFRSMGSGVEMTKGKWEKLGKILYECSAIATQALSGD